MADVISKKLKDWLANSEKVVVAGVGNPIRRDDYVGLKIVETLKGKLPENILLLETETVPESYLTDIEEFHPTHVLLIDAAFLGLEPGKTSLVEAEKITDTSSVTTHVLPLRIFCEFVEKVTGAKIALLLIEPGSVEFGESLTAPVQVSANRLVRILVDLLG